MNLYTFYGTVQDFVRMKKHTLLYPRVMGARGKEEHLTLNWCLVNVSMSWDVKHGDDLAEHRLDAFTKPAQL